MKIYVTAPNIEDYPDVPRPVLGEPIDALIIDPRKQFVMHDMFLNNAHETWPKIIATPSTGTNHIDLEDMERRGIKVLSLKDNQVWLNEITASSEFTLQLLMEAFRSQRKEISGKTIVLVGFGRIGRNMAGYLRELRAYTQVYDPLLFPGTNVSLPDKVATSDAMVICCTLNEETTGMIDGKLLEKAKDDYIVVNTARDAVVNAGEMKHWLHTKKDARYFSDFLRQDLIEYKNYWATPHLAGDTTDSNKKAADIILDLVRKELGK